MLRGTQGTLRPSKRAKRTLGFGVIPLRGMAARMRLKVGDDLGGAG